jgi:peptidyl-prolyl cis-trans isomerase-like 2
MGKNKHSKDRMFLTATEWRVDYGGKKHLSLSKGQILPFDHCALSLTPLTDPCCTPEVVNPLLFLLLLHSSFSLFFS